MLSLPLVGTVLAALAPNLGVLIVGRVLQGAAGADAFTIGFWVSAGVGLLAIIAAVAAPPVRARRREAAEAGVDDLEFS